MPWPVCVKCSVEMRCDKNDHAVELMAGELGYQLWSGDRWKCPKCGHEVISGYGIGPLVQHFEDDYAEEVSDREARGDFTRVEDRT